MNQSFRNFELIVVDDGSTDETVSLVRRYEDSRIRLVRKENGGISSARNAGLNLVRGRYIAFLDSDDEWLPDMLAWTVPVLESRPEFGVVYARGQSMDRNGRPLDQWEGVPARFPGDDYASMLYGFFGCIQTSLIRRECFDRAGLFDENLAGRVDYDLFLRISRYFRFHFLDAILAHIRVHPGRITAPASSRYIQVFTSRLKVLDKAYAEPELPSSVLAIKPLAYRNAHMDLGLHWWNIGQYRQALSCYGRSVRVSGVPLRTLFRIGFQLLMTCCLGRTPWGARLPNLLAGIRTRLEKRRRRPAESRGAHD